LQRRMRWTSSTLTLAKKLNSKINELRGVRYLESTEPPVPFLGYVVIGITGVFAFIGDIYFPKPTDQKTTDRMISSLNKVQPYLILGLIIGSILVIVAFIVCCIMIDRLNTAKAKKAISQIKVGDTFSWGNLGEGTVISNEEPSPFIKAQFANGEIWHIDVLGRAGFRMVD